MKSDFVKNYAPAIIMAAVIFYLSSLPGSSVPRLSIKFEDLFLHFIEYGVFGYTLGLALLSKSADMTRRRILAAVLIGILYGISDEYHQSFVPGRVPSPYDVVADSLGTMFGIYFYLNRVRFIGRFLIKKHTADAS